MTGPELLMVEEQLEKAKAMQNKSKAEIMRLVYEYRQANPDMSFREVGKQFNLDHKTAKKYVDKHAATLEAEKAKEEKTDFEDKAVEALDIQPEKY